MTEGSNLDRERDPDLSGNQCLSNNTSPSDGQETLSKSLYASGLQFFSSHAVWVLGRREWEMDMVMHWEHGTMLLFLLLFYVLGISNTDEVTLHRTGKNIRLRIANSKAMGTRKVSVLWWEWLGVRQNRESWRQRSRLWYMSCSRGVGQDVALAEWYRNEATEVAECLTGKKVQIFFFLMWNLQVFKCWLNTKSQKNCKSPP